MHEGVDDGEVVPLGPVGRRVRRVDEGGGSSTRRRLSAETKRSAGESNGFAWREWKAERVTPVVDGEVCPDVAHLGRLLEPRLQLGPEAGVGEAPGGARSGEPAQWRQRRLALATASS
jgi:hypothetical protein